MMMGREVKAIFAVIAVVAIIGNSLTVAVFFRKPSWLKRAHFCLILALSIQDILTGICLLVVPSFLPDENAYSLPENVVSRRLYCSIVWSQYIPFALGITSVYTCFMLTLDRWLAVSKPLSFKKYQQSRKIIALLVLTPWILGFGLEYPSLIHTEFVKQHNTTVCVWKQVDDKGERNATAVLSFVSMILIPAVLMTIAYVHVILQLRKLSARVSTASRAHRAGKMRGLSALKRVTCTAIFASAVVIICWFPDQLYYALTQVGVAEIGTKIHHAFKILAFSNSCFNPFIYCFSNAEYRKALKEMLCCLPSTTGDGNTDNSIALYSRSVVRAASKTFEVNNEL